MTKNVVKYCCKKIKNKSKNKNKKKAKIVSQTIITSVQLTCCLY